MMKKISAPAIFMTAALVGSLLVGSGVGAQSTSTNGPVTCTAPSYSITVGQPLTLNASGGDGNYTWSGPGLVISNPNGSRFNVSFNTPGIYPVTVVSAGVGATCNITVTALSNPVPTPGLPNTGELE